MKQRPDQTPVDHLFKTIQRMPKKERRLKIQGKEALLNLSKDKQAVKGVLSRFRMNVVLYIVH